MSRNRYIARQLKAALRRCRWDAGTIALRAAVSRGTMARVLVGDEDVALGVYDAVATELELNIAFSPWTLPEQLHPSAGSVETVVDLARRKVRSQGLSDLAGMFKTSEGVEPVSIEDMRVGGWRPGG